MLRTVPRLMPDINYVDCFDALGNGNAWEGAERLHKFAMWLRVERMRHPAFSGESIEARMRVLLDELQEVIPSTPAFDAKLMDIITVAWRTLNKEYAAHKEPHCEC